MSRDLGQYIAKRPAEIYGPTAAMHPQPLHDRQVRQASALYVDSDDLASLNLGIPEIRSRTASAASTINTNIACVEVRFSHKDAVLTDQDLGPAGCVVTCSRSSSSASMPPTKPMNDPVQLGRPSC